MIRDTFETNPGLCELFRNKITQRARFAGLSEDLIDFDTHLDMKGTYQDNMRIFYREYPQLSQNSDYLRIKSMRPLTGAALDRSWQSFEQNNEHETAELTGAPSGQQIIPEVVITYTIGDAPGESGREEPEPPGSIPKEPITPRIDSTAAASTYRELVKSILDHVTVLAGEKTTRMIVRHMEREMSRATLNPSRDHQPLPHHLAEALHDVLHNRRNP